MNTSICLINLETGEQIIREMDFEELKNHAEIVEKSKIDHEARLKKKQDRHALFVKMGFTEAEAKLLLS